MTLVICDCGLFLPESLCIDPQETRWPKLSQQPELREEARKELQEQLRLRQEVKALEERDVQLWSIAALVIVVLAAGVAGLLLPNAMWHLRVLRFEGNFLPQLCYGLITLVILFNIYVLRQRRELRQAREELVLQMVYNEAAERLSLVDPLTDTFNRRYMDQVIAKDLSRAERHGIQLCFLMIDIDDFKSANTKFGHLTGDRILVEVAQVLKRTFRASDTIIRFGGDEFLAVLSDTAEDGANRAIGRLTEQVRRWNAGPAVAGYCMALSCGFAVYSKGADLKDVLNAADQNMYQQKAST